MTTEIAAFSGGKDSTAMSLALRDQGIHAALVYTPTGDELPGVDAHIESVSQELSLPLIRVGFPGGLHALVRREKMLPNWRARFCTRILKIVPFQKYIQDHRPATVYVGLRADEEGRAGVDSMWPDVEIRYPLRELGWGLSDVLDCLETHGITIPTRTDCARCFFQTLHEWWLLWKNYPDIYQDAVEEERLIGHTYRSPARDSRPAALAELRDDFEAGYTPAARERKNGCRYCTL
jgi:3'-phosphoadenosine 5'-phosphosulfate sulfotransferase (PAPS reductase)/FAD synthetase